MFDTLITLLKQYPFIVGAITTPLCLYVISSLLAPTFDYKGKHVMVTGGSSGIGLEVNELVNKPFNHEVM